MSNIIRIAADVTKTLNDHSIEWSMVAESSGTVRLHAARAGFVPANPRSPHAIGAHTLTLTELDDDYAGDPSDPYSVKLTPTGQTEIKVETLTLVPLSGAERSVEQTSAKTWRLSEIIALAEKWLVRVIEIEASSRPAVEDEPVKHWSPVFDEATGKFFIQIDGTHVVLGAFYSSQELAQKTADRLNAAGAK